MRLTLFIAFIFSIMLNALALTVVINPYEGLNYDEPVAFDIHRIEDEWEECFCPQ